VELTIVLMIALLVLGSKRSPEAGRSLGQAIRGCRRSLAGTDRDHAGFDEAGTHRPTGDEATARRQESDA